LLRRTLLPLAAVLLALWLWLGATPSDGPVVRTALVMGTLVEIKAYGADPNRLDTAITEAFAEMARLEQLFSAHLEQSEIRQLSAARGVRTVSSEVAELLILGQMVARRSQGAFDMGLGRLVALWDLQSESPKVPSGEQIGAALRGTGPESLTINGQQVKKTDPALQLDLGGIAKGYAVDRAVAVLRQAGVKSAAVNAGGDIRLLGDRLGEDWRIGIQHPRKAGEVMATIALRDRSVVTSGDYERFFEQDGRRYHHLLDPRTGYPARGCQSVTVIAGDAALADALATAAFVLGPRAGLALLERMTDVEGFVITDDGQRLVTTGLDGQLQWF